MPAIHVCQGHPHFISHRDVGSNTQERNPSSKLRDSDEKETAGQGRPGRHTFDFRQAALVLARMRGESPDDARESGGHNKRTGNARHGFHSRAQQSELAIEH